MSTRCHDAMKPQYTHTHTHVKQLLPALQQRHCFSSVGFTARSPQSRFPTVSPTNYSIFHITFRPHSSNLCGSTPALRDEMPTSTTALDTTESQRRHRKQRDRTKNNPQRAGSAAVQSQMRRAQQQLVGVCRWGPIHICSVCRRAISFGPQL